MYLQDNGVPANEGRKNKEKSISVNRNDEKKCKSIYYTLKAPYIMIKVGGLIIPLEIHLVQCESV